MSDAFEVVLKYPMNEFSAEKDDAIFAAAGRQSEWSGGGMGLRDIGWTCQTFEQAQELKCALSPFGSATIREAVTFD